MSRNKNEHVFEYRNKKIPKSRSFNPSWFLRETGGNMSVLALTGSIVMAIFGGVGIDIMHNELQRTKLQNTLDRAVLSAANLSQNLDPNEVVEDYVEKSGLLNTLTGVSVDQGLSYRSVTASAEKNTDAIFLNMLGVQELHSNAVSQAEERIANVEISMVLDISGSMGSNNKVVNLRNAATEFVNTVVQTSDSGLTTINIVPYNATVNVGSTLAAHYTIANDHSYSNCATFDNHDFLTTSIDPLHELERLAHFDPWSSSTSSTQISNSWCADDEYGSILAFSSDKDALNAHIATLGAGGNTAIDLGMKWGVGLLDPGTQSVVDGLIQDGEVTALASGRPANWTADDAIKIVVLMTDGANTTQYDLKDHFKSGMSDIYIDDRGDNDPSNDRFSRQIRDYSGTSNDVYFWTRYDGSSWSNKYRNYPDGDADAVQMSYPEVFARWGTRGFGRKFYRRPYYDNWINYSEYRDAYYAYTSTVNSYAADDRLADICAAAKDEDITVFAIGFEAPSRGQAAMSNCASSPAHYFSVEGLEISEAFRQIARTINQLRLTL